MGQDATIEKKLELIRTLRQEQAYNEGALLKRQGILYPEYGHKVELENTKTEEPKVTGTSGFRLRLLIAVVLFFLFFYMDLNHVSIGGMSSDGIHNMVTQVFDVNSFDFATQFPYTEIDKKQ